MGLDMYLEGHIYLYGATLKFKKQLQKLMKLDYPVDTIEVQVGYWRKANQIHKWFVDNVQGGNDDCGTYYVSEEKLNALLKDVNTALESDTPKEVLPTQSGFFFGSIEYDEYYKQDLTDTKDIIEKWLKSPNKNKIDLYYHSSW